MSALAQLTQIQDTINTIAQTNEGGLLLDLLKGPVYSFFDKRNFAEKGNLEEYIDSGLIEICQTHGQKQRNMSGYFEDTIKLVNILQQIPGRDQQYKALVKNCKVTEDLGSAEIFEAIESLFGEKGDTAKLENLMS